MLQFREIRWNELLPEGEKLIPYLLEKNVPVYFRADAVYHLVYHCRQHALSHVGEVEKRRTENFVCENGHEKPNVPDVALIPVGSFLDCDLAFLRLDSSSLEQIGISRSCIAPRFTRGGLVAKPAYRVIGSDSRGRPIRAPEEPKGVRVLVGVEFDEAVVIDRNAWTQAGQIGGRLTRADPLDYVLQGEIKREELFLDVVDITRLQQERRPTIEHVAYPYRHENRMPGLYWMFQAAYRLNELAAFKEGKKEVGGWLMKSAPKTFRYRTLRTAEKFVWPVVDRNQGGDERGEFDLGEIDELCGDGARSKYKFDYTSDGLAMILAIADFWFDLVEDDPNAVITDLAKKLMVNRFGGLEVGDLVYLIAGQRVDLAIESSLKEWVDREDKLAREAGRREIGWRDVIDQEERERLLKKKERQKTECKE